MRLASQPDILWPMPITLNVERDVLVRLALPTLPCRIGLVETSDGPALAILQVQEIFEPDRTLEASLVYGTTSTAHPGVALLAAMTDPCCLGGPLQAIALPSLVDHKELRLTPRQLRANFVALGLKRVLAFQTRNPMHRAHQALTLRAMAVMPSIDALLLHPTIGPTRPGDIQPATRVRAYQAILSLYPASCRVILALVPLAMRMAGPREALLHAIVRRNYGASVFLIGRDHAGPGNHPDGVPFYAPFAAQVWPCRVSLSRSTSP